jgi:hypothetical protein
MKKIYTPHQYRVYFHYYATISACNNYLISPVIENFLTVGYNKTTLSENKHKALDIDDFMNNESKQYSKGNFVDEWLWKYPCIK